MSETAADVLEQLASDNFLDITIASNLVYRFNPATPSLEADAERFAEYYRLNAIAVTKLIAAGSPGAARDFVERSG